jgi:hypothetical protein
MGHSSQTFVPSRVSAPVALDPADWRRISGGLPKGTWTEPTGLPKGTWGEPDQAVSGDEYALPKGTW